MPLRLLPTASGSITSLGRNGGVPYSGRRARPLEKGRARVMPPPMLAYRASAATGLMDGTRPGRLAWLLKARILQPLYWQSMVKGREGRAQPELVR